MIIFIMISTFSVCVAGVKMHSLSKQSESRDNSAEINNKPGCGGGRCHCNHFCVIPLPTCKHLSHQTFSFMPYFKDTQQGPKKSLQK